MDTIKQSTADSINDNLNVRNALFQVQNYEPYNYCMVHIIRQTDCPTDANAGSTALSMHENNLRTPFKHDSRCALFSLLSFVSKNSTPQREAQRMSCLKGVQRLPLIIFEMLTISTQESL